MLPPLVASRLLYTARMRANDRPPGGSLASGSARQGWPCGSTRHAILPALLCWCAFALAAFAGNETVERQCGLVVKPPGGWSAIVKPPRRSDDGIRCEIGLRPAGWEATRKESHWGLDEFPAWIIVYKVPFEKALECYGFELDQGELTLMGGYGTRAAVRPVRLGRWSGYRADTFYRGFLKQQYRGVEEEGSPIFSGEIARVFVHDRRGRTLAVTWYLYTPDTPPDLEDVALGILERAKFR